MIFTVTLNPALDKTVVIENLRVGCVNRINTIRLDAGGKGINVSKCLEVLGLRSTAAALLGGTAGEQFLALLARTRIDPLVVKIPGETRTNLKVIDPVLHQNTDINEPGPEVTADILLELRNQIAAKICPGDIVILSGSLPKGAAVTTYRDWTAFFRSLGALVYLDADGEALKQGVDAVPYLAKPNNEELSRLAGAPLNRQDELITAGQQLLQKGIHTVVISLGAEGALFLTGKGTYKAHSLNVPVRSTVGAGDSMVAALAYGMEKKLDEISQLKLAIAISAASVMCDGTQAPEAGAIEELYHKVIIEEVF